MKNNMLDKIDEYFKNTPKEKVQEAWDSTKAYDKVGCPTVKELQKHLNQLINNKL